MGYKLIKIIRKPIERWIHRLEPAAVIEPERFSWIKDMEEKYFQIREEAEQILRRIDSITNFDTILPNQRALYQGDLWKSFFLKVAKKDVPGHQKICPHTTEALKNIPGIINAFFSILKPGTNIPPHRGPYAGILRYHLGIIIPEGDVGIIVNGQLCRWKEGESLLFDDSFEHEAWNRTAAKRVILFVDLVRPLPKTLSVINRLILLAFKFTKTARTTQQRVMDTQISSN